MPLARRLAAVARRLWRTSPPLAGVGLLMLGVAALSLVGLAVDPRVITGAPAWLKPLKFAVSTAVYALTLAWVFESLPDWPRVRRVVGWTTAVVFVLEVAIIDAQAWRGTTSHFNVATRRDQLLFATMGAAILLQTLTSAAVAVALWRQRFADQTLGRALRFGMTLTIVGAFSGGLMTRPTARQLDDLQAGKHVATIGAHTVGALDGGAGIPVTGWSRDHGDLRVPHFVGLHALQALALVALVLGRVRRPDATRARLMTAAATSYAALFALLLWDALRGRSLVALDATTLAALAGWAALTAFALAWLGRRPSAASPNTLAAGAL
jgi:hypothetical protein